MMVGPFGDWIKYTYEYPIDMAFEIDGARIISNDKCELLQKVPTFTENIFKIGLTEPAAVLFDALDHYDINIPFGLVFYSLFLLSHSLYASY